MSNMPIGRLAQLTGVKVTTIRFYESIGLLPEPARTANERRTYGAAAVQRLGFVKHARQLGFSVDAIRDLLELCDNPHRACDRANEIAKEQLDAVNAKIAQLKALQAELSRMVSARCRGVSANCRVIESLSDHAFCAHDHDLPGRVVKV